MTQEQAADVRKLAEELAKALVEKPDEVTVTPVEERGETVLELSVAESDIGKIIGKQGRTVRALRNVVAAAGTRQHQRIVLEVLE
jgi:uncharacterized protein